MPDLLDDLVAWSVKCGHYVLAPLVANFRQYKAQRAENEKDALREKVAGDE